MNEYRCRKCNINCVGDWVQRLCNRNVTHLYRRCTNCDGRSQFISMSEYEFMGQSIQEVIDDRCQLCLGQGCPRCEVKPCEVKCCTSPHHLVETHHWAPKRKFKGDADLWPTSRLCKYHHDEWHKVMT